MTKIVLIRPGATDFDIQGRIQGQLDIPLSADGEAEIRGVIPQLKSRALEVIYCSPGEPARRTAELIGDELELRIKELAEFENLNLGLWQGMLVDEVKHKQPKVYRQWLEQPESVCPPGGETIAQAQVRVEAGLQRIYRKIKDGVVGLVVPEPLASLVRARLEGGGLGDLWRAGVLEHGHWQFIDSKQPVASEKVVFRGTAVGN